MSHEILSIALLPELERDDIHSTYICVLGMPLYMRVVEF